MRRVSHAPSSRRSMKSPKGGSLRSKEQRIEFIAPTGICLVPVGELPPTTWAGSTARPFGVVPLAYLRKKRGVAKSRLDWSGDALMTKERDGPWPSHGRYRRDRDLKPFGPRWGRDGLTPRLLSLTTADQRLAGQWPNSALATQRRPRVIPPETAFGTLRSGEIVPRSELPHSWAHRPARSHQARNLGRVWAAPDP
jgi:hypothetical protein